MYCAVHRVLINERTLVSSRTMVRHVKVCFDELEDMFPEYKGNNVLGDHDAVQIFTVKSSSETRNTS